MSSSSIATASLRTIRRAKWIRERFRRCWKKRWRNRPAMMLSGERSILRRSILRRSILRNVFANVVVARGGQLTGIAIENYFAVFQNQEAHRHFATLTFGQRDHLVGGFVEVMGRHGEGILKAMSHHQRAGLVHVALFHDEFDDGI